MPQSGTLVDWRPGSGEGVRVDHGLQPGAVVSPFYDPMLAKVVAHGATREEARRRLILALKGTIAFGLDTNRNFLVEVLRHPSFVAGEATTAFIERYFPAGSDAMRRPSPDPRMVALAAILLFESRKSGAESWSSTGTASWPLQLAVENARQEAIVTVVAKDRYSIALGKNLVEVSIEDRQAGVVRFTAEEIQQTAHFALHDGILHLDLNGAVAAVRETTHEGGAAERREGSARLLAPMNGAIISVQAKPGDRVTRGQRIVVLEAMKMQHELAAERDGVVDKVLVKPGDQVATRQLLVELKADEGLKEATA